MRFDWEKTRKSLFRSEMVCVCGKLPVIVRYGNSERFLQTPSRERVGCSVSLSFFTQVLRRHAKTIHDFQRVCQADV